MMLQLLLRMYKGDNPKFIPNTLKRNDLGDEHMRQHKLTWNTACTGVFLGAEKEKHESNLKKRSKAERLTRGKRSFEHNLLKED